MTATTHEVCPIGWVRSTLKRRADAPKQGYEGAPDARIEVEAAFQPGLDRLTAGQDLLILTWLHEAQRDAILPSPSMASSPPARPTGPTRSAFTACASSRSRAAACCTSLRWRR
jgi:tRNA (Thr-GGU) A37 N-methylase